MSNEFVNAPVQSGLVSEAGLDRRVLHDNWRMREAGGEEWLPAAVPGNNFLDLLAAGKIPDPFHGANERQVQWVADRDWEFQTTFFVDEKTLGRDRIDLVFQGLDTYAEVLLNGAPILSAENMFIEHRCSVKSFLTEGENTLTVHFTSPLSRTRPLEAANGYKYPAENDHSDEKLSVFSRKAPYQFGWDWGPRLICSGIWRPVVLESYDVMRIGDIQHRIVSLDEEVAHLEFDIEIDADIAMDISLDLSFLGDGFGLVETDVSLAPGANKVKVPVSVVEPELWQPVGHGDQRLYEARISLRDGDRLLAARDTRLGLRTVELVTAKDDIGEEFTIKVNGKPIFMKGANYIPSDSFPERMTEARYRELFQSTVDANMNMLRVWGGGIYEEDLFYQLADEYGVLIWQDFMFACTLYPASDEFLANVEAEARFQLRRLRKHPSIALWCGNNEIELGIGAWDWPEKFGYDEERYAQLKDDYRTLFCQLLPALVAEEDPDAFYFPSSPIGDWEDEADDNRGDSHYWGVWHGGLPFTEYERRIPRFMSEYGFQSLPLMASIEKFLEPGDRETSSDAMRVHQKHPRGYALIDQYMAPEYEIPTDFGAYAYLSQVQQADGLKKAFAAHRLARPHCMGTLFWQMNDCWPVASWSAIDYYGRKKALYYEAKRSFAPIAVFLREIDGALRVDGVNDTSLDVSGELQLSLVTADGDVRWTHRESTSIEADGVSALWRGSQAELPDAENRKDHYLIATFASDLEQLGRDVLKFSPTKDMNASIPEVTVSTHQDGERLTLEVSADRVAMGVYLSLPDSWGIVNLEDNFITLLPGEVRRFELPATVAADENACEIRVQTTRTPIAALVDGAAQIVKIAG